MSSARPILAILNRIMAGKSLRNDATQLEGFASNNIYGGSVIAQDGIRILLLEPSSTMDHPIVCNLEVASLAHKPVYEALSYTWEPPVAGESLRDSEIRLCGERIEIKGNLGHALQRFRCSNTCRRLWVDALCINQNNDMERNQQVALMPRIYRNAKVVQVWLGEDSSDAKISIAYLHNVYDSRVNLKQLSAAREYMTETVNIEEIQHVLFGPRTELGRYIQRMYDSERLRLAW